jgi:hypothetical protein
MFPGWWTKALMLGSDFLLEALALPRREGGRGRGGRGAATVGQMTHSQQEPTSLLRVFIWISDFSDYFDGILWKPLSLV